MIQCEKCHETMFAISCHDKPKVKTHGKVVAVDRTLRYRCINGHRQDIVKRVPIIDNPPEPTPPSHKRFHRKGFEGHIVRPAHPDSKYPVESLLCLASLLEAFKCRNDSVKDGYCLPHWRFLFKGMSNKTRMVEKRHLRNIVREKAQEIVQAG